MVDVNKTMPPMGGWGEITALPRPVADSPVADRVGSYRATRRLNNGGHEQNHAADGLVG